MMMNLFRRNKREEVKVRYELTLGYNCGMLATSKFYDTVEEAREVAEDYKNNFEDLDKYYIITKVGNGVEKVESWFE